MVGTANQLPYVNEFGSEEEDIEFRLYQQLYFEPNPDITLPHSNTSPTDSEHGTKTNAPTDQGHEPQDSRTNQEQNPEPMETVTDCTKSNELNSQIDDNIYIDVSEGSQIPLSTFLRTNDPLAQKAENSVHARSRPSQSDVVSREEKAALLRSVRGRLTSTGSDVSISGSVPLDVLYYNLVTSEEEDEREEGERIRQKVMMKKVNKQHEKGSTETIAKAKKRKRKDSSSDSENKDSRCDTMVSAASNSAERTDSNEDETHSEDDLYVLSPPEAKNPEILTLESSSGEEEKAETEGISRKTKHNKTIESKDPEKTKATQNLESRRKRRRKEKNFDPLESDSNDVDFPEATRGTDLFLNIDKSLVGLVKTITKEADSPKKNKTKRRRSKGMKSSVDFTVRMPKKTRIPSCEKWTQDMAAFYDSDTSEDFDVREIHSQQSDTAKDWRLVPQDYYINQRRRYYNNVDKCKLCRQEGHVTSKCPRVLVCHLCSSTEHWGRRNCPENCCFKCGGEPHYFCPTVDSVRTCNLCGFSGHHKDLCPDLWRRYHVTTSGLEAQFPAQVTTKPPSDQYCCSCAGQGHYGHQCPMKFVNRSHLHVPQLVFSYGVPVVEGFDSFPVREDSVTTIPIKSTWIGRIIGKKGAKVKSVIKESGAVVKVLDEENIKEVRLFGSHKARLKAKEMIVSLIGTRVIKKLEKKLQSSDNLNDTPVNNGTSDNGLPTPSPDDLTSPGTSDDHDAWCTEYLDSIKPHKKGSLLKEIHALLNMFNCKKMLNINSSVIAVRRFYSKKKSKSDKKNPSDKVKKHIKKLAINVIGKKKYGDSRQIYRKIVSLMKWVECCQAKIVPYNLCMELARTLKRIYEPSMDQLALLLQCANQYQVDYSKRPKDEKVNGSGNDDEEKGKKSNNTNAKVKTKGKKATKTKGNKTINNEMKKATKTKKNKTKTKNNKIKRKKKSKKKKANEEVGSAN